MSRHQLVLGAAAASLLLLAGTAAGGNGVETRVLSLDTTGGPASSSVQFVDVSGTGRFVAFSSHSTDLITSDTNGSQDIFLRNTVSGSIQRVSVRSNGNEAVGNSDYPSISANGKVIAFQSSAPFAAADTGEGDIYVRDRTTGKTTWVSRGIGGAQPDDQSFAPAVSANGRYVAFYSWATNLVPNDQNGSDDVFVYDRETKSLERVSVTSDGTEETGDSSDPHISGDGRRVVFESFAVLSSDDDDGGAQNDIYMHDRGTDKTKLISVNSQGFQANQGSSLPAISDDGKHVVFASAATNLAPNDDEAFFSRIFVRTLKTGKTELGMSLWDPNDVNGHSGDPDISGTGRYVVFETDATNLVSGDSAGDYDVFRYDRETGRMHMMSVSTGGSQGGPDAGAFVAKISADGRFGVYISDAEGLVPETTFNGYDAFIHGPMSGNG